MTAEDLLVTLRGQHVTLIPHADGTLHCKASRRILTPEQLAAIRQYKAELYALVEAEAQPVAIPTIEESPPLASGGSGAAPLDPDYPCTVCHGTVRWNHAGIWRQTPPTHPFPLSAFPHHPTRN
jgi:hypothetical protein